MDEPEILRLSIPADVYISEIIVLGRRLHGGFGEGLLEIVSWRARDLMNEIIVLKEQPVRVSVHRMTDRAESPSGGKSG